MSDRRPFHVLVTGASGFLGWNLCRERPAEWRLTGVACTQPLAPVAGVEPRQADLTRYEELKALLRAARPDAVLHAAAMAEPNRCEREPAAARRINVEAAVSLAGLCADAGIPCLFISTDLVFDGRHAPYAEEAEPAPINRYGEQKALAEQGMRERCPALIVCRLPLLFGAAGPHAQSFLPPLVAALRAGPPPRLFTDEFRTPVSGREAARGLWHILATVGGQPGLFHLGGPERISRHGFGQLTAELLGTGAGTIIPCRQADVAMPAARPADVSLDSRRARGQGWNPPPLRAELAAELAALAVAAQP
ncbi:MAG: NAD(P)-dependent oxidoreductase [Lentisphaeria bacterium]|jgi:dTDP-4-dehydrorhamnose reductase